MQLVILRLVFGAAFLFVIREAVANARAAPDTGDGANAVLLALSLIIGLANAAVWAPYIGSKLSEPLTMTLTDGAPYEHRTRLLDLARQSDQGGRRRRTVFLCLLETLWRPNQPAAYLIGLKNAQPGTWLERYFALHVFRFDNAAHSIDAYRTLRKHGMDPRPHRNPEINTILSSLERKPTVTPPPVPLGPQSVTARLKRDPRIRLFDVALAAPPPEARTEATGPPQSPTSDRQNGVAEQGVHPPG
jgi:hypothetical protein